MVPCQMFSETRVNPRRSTRSMKSRPVLRRRWFQSLTRSDGSLRAPWGRPRRWVRRTSSGVRRWCSPQASGNEFVVIFSAEQFTERPGSGAPIVGFVRVTGLSGSCLELGRRVLQFLICRPDLHRLTQQGGVGHVSPEACSAIRTAAPSNALVTRTRARIGGSLLTYAARSPAARFSPAMCCPPWRR
jgi:hypothetical protein